MKIKIFSVFLLALAIFTAGKSFCQASEERIISFVSEITVHEDSTMAVTEKIKVYSSGMQIKRGIYRDFPTTYQDKYGNNLVVDFRVVEVLRDGLREDYHIESLYNGKRLYIGNKNIYIQPGEYIYTIRYETDRQLGFFPGFDELYWNVTGNGWAFPIDEVKAIVRLPQDAGKRIIESSGYTGAMGSNERAVFVSRDDFSGIIFNSSRRLVPGEGLTIVVTWPKGYVKEPSFEKKASYVFRDNSGGICAFISLLVLVGYYLFVWVRVGKDPAKGTIIPLYEPPANLSPAQMRYIVKMGFDNKIVASTIINMAVKGYIKIKEESGVYELTRNKVAAAILMREELEFAQRLFGREDKLDLKNTNYNIINTAIGYLKKFLKNSCEKIYFITNRQYFITGSVLSLILMFGSILFQSIQTNHPEKIFITLFMSVWLSIWTAGVTILLSNVVSLWRSIRQGISVFGQALFLTFFSIPFIAGEILGLGMLFYTASFAVFAVILAVIFTNILFYHLLRAPTFKGRKIMDRIEGFKMYLSVAEKNRLNVLNPPEETPEIFEKYLPYALALDVEQQWAEKFSDVLSRAAVGGEKYHPSWYSGSGWNSLNTAAFASNLGSTFSNAISSSATAPASTSGSGGGGFSGGGGGGGGGGGW